MGKTTLARQRAMGIIGRFLVEAVEAAGVVFVDRVDYERLIQRRAELEAEVKRLRAEREAVVQ